MKKILVIEDEQFIRENIVEILEASDYQVLSAPDGAVGVELALQHLPDLILCDVMMPELDGHGVLQQLRENPATYATPFIFLTAKANTKDLREGMNLGADDYLTKPFRVPDLLTAVSTRLEKSLQDRRKADERLEELRNNIALSLPHEFLTPISGILGCAELLRTSMDLMSREEVNEMLEQLSYSARRLNRLVQNFLLHARLISAGVEHSAEEIRAQLLAGDFTESARAVIADVVQTKSTQDHRENDMNVTIEGDAAIAMRQMYFSKIIEELVDNAIKYSHSGAPIVLSASVVNNVFVFVIVNIGRHMLPEQIASIGAYTQFDRKIYEQQGSGLGLSIAKKLLEFHGGRLDIESIDGQTTVTIKIPLAQLSE